MNAISRGPSVRGKNPKPQILRKFAAPNTAGSKPQGDTFVMCPPEYLSTRIANNVFMKNEKVNIERALRQYGRTKHLMEALGVTVLEIPSQEDCQDQVYTANIGVSIEPYVILSKYKAPGRDCEIEPAKKFFEGLGYQVIQPPVFFEGEADLKLWKDKTYFGGFGQFSDNKAYDWIEKQTGVKIIRLREIEPKLFHLDCSLAVINDTTVIANRKGIAPESFKLLESLVNVIEPPKGLETCGITNGVLIHDKRIYLSGTLQPEVPDYRKAIEWLNKTMDNFGYSVVFCDCDEYDKSGADLSCSVMHLTF